VSNGKALAESITTGQEPERPGKALADSLRKELFPDAKPPTQEPTSLADSIRADFKKAGFKPEEREPTFLEKLVTGLIADPLKETSRAVQFALISGLQPGASGYAKLAQYLSTLPPEQAEKEKNEAMRGAAFVYSFAGGPLIKSAPVVGRLLGKWGSFLAGEMLGGGIYGGVRPLDKGESRTGAMAQDAAFFAGAGIAFKGAGEATSWALKRYILRMAPAKQRIALGMAKAGLDRIEEQLSNGGVMLNQLPPEEAAQLEEPVLRRAIQVADPSVVNIDEIGKQQVGEELEIHTRLKEERPTLKLPETTVEDEFQKAVGKTKMPDALRELTDKELADAHPLGATPPLEESAAGPSARQPTVERRVAEHPVDVERRRTAEDITGVAVKGRSGKIYPAEKGEVAHPQIMARMIESGVPESEFIDEYGAYSHSEVAGYTTTRRPFVSKLQAVKEGLKGATAREYLVGPVVKGKSGKLYIGGATHKETIARAIASGAPASEFEGAGWNSPARGFKTNIHDFVNREYAAALSGRVEPLISEDMHKAGLTSIESPEVAEKNLENVARQSALPGTETPPEAVMDAALDHAVASVKPLDVAASVVKEDASIVKQEIHSLPKRGPKAAERLRGILSAALDREGPAAEKSVLVGLTDPDPSEISLERKAAGTPHEQNFRREQVAASLKRETPLIEVGAEQQVSAPWITTDPEVVTPVKMDGLELAVNFTDKELNTLSDVLKNEKGELTASLLGRLTAVGVGAWADWEGLTNENLSPGLRAGLISIGTFLIGAAAYDRLSSIAAKELPGRLEPMRKLTKNIVTAYNPVNMMNDYPKGKEFFRQYVEMIMSWKQEAYEHGLIMDKMYSDEGANRAAMFVADEGRTAPEFQMLTPAQQQHALWINLYNLRLGMLSNSAGFLNDYKQSYVRHLLPADSFEKWRLTGYKVGPGGAFTKDHIYSLRELEAWAARNGVEGPMMKMSSAHASRLGEFSREMASARLRSALENVGLVADVPKTSMTPIPDGWRPIKGILDMPDKMAPDAIARALENIAAPRASRFEIINALDGVKSLWMRAIMFWWWEHGFNVIRSFVNLSMNPVDYANTFRYLREMDGLDAQMARHGGNLHDRPDRAAFATQQARALFDAVGLPKLGGKYAKFAEWEDKKLWDHVVPSLQRFSYAMQMYKFAERTGGKFLEGSPEFTATARKAADFSNAISGRVPRLLQDPKLSRGMRLLMFSPQWTMTRLSLLANAAGEAGEIMKGNIHADATYLKFKMRQLGWGIAVTGIGSYLMSGKWPTFNPNSTKFYMRTGLHDPNGREIGLDVIGWWQDDIRLFNAPLNFVQNRLNPSLRLANEVISGRDYLGRPMTPGQRIGDILTSFGPIPEIASDVFRVGQAATGGRPIRGAEGLQMASRATATFRTSTLPRPMDAVVGKFAKKLLLKQGMAASDDNIYELSKLLRGNLLANRDMIDNRVIFYLANLRKNSVLKHPAATAIWQEARRVLADF
jgi:hypothetical protein